MIRMYAFSLFGLCALGLVSCNKKTNTAQLGSESGPTTQEVASPQTPLPTPSAMDPVVEQIVPALTNGSTVLQLQVQGKNLDKVVANKTFLTPRDTTVSTERVYLQAVENLSADKTRALFIVKNNATDGEKINRFGVLSAILKLVINEAMAQAPGVQLLMGPQGVAGPAGPAGARGIDGRNGTNGANGLPGSPGPQGPAGPQGQPGATGPAGPVGPRGVAGLIDMNKLYTVSYSGKFINGQDECKDIYPNSPLPGQCFIWGNSGGGDPVFRGGTGSANVVAQANYAQFMIGLYCKDAGDKVIGMDGQLERVHILADFYVTKPEDKILTGKIARAFAPNDSNGGTTSPNSYNNDGRIFYFYRLKRIPSVPWSDYSQPGGDYNVSIQCLKP